MSQEQYSSSILERASKIKILLMDVDGVMTDGNLYYLPDAQGNIIESKGFNSHDGLGLRFCYLAGIPTGVISGLVSPGTVERAKTLKMRYIYQGCLDKNKAWNEILADAKVESFQVAYIGDDIIDVPLMHRAGLAIAPHNARPEAKKMAHYITPNRGGQGTVRDAVELILKSQNLWEQAIQHYQPAVLPN